MPGQHKFAYTVAEIDPVSCAGFNNVVILCGLNDIRKPEVDEAMLKKVYCDFKSKITEIRKVNGRQNSWSVLCFRPRSLS